MNKLILSSCLVTALFSSSAIAQNTPNQSQDMVGIPQSGIQTAPNVQPAQEQVEGSPRIMFDSNGFLIDPNNPQPSQTVDNQANNNLNNQAPQGYPQYPQGQYPMQQMPQQQMPQQIQQGYPQYANATPYGVTQYDAAQYGAMPVNATPMMPPSDLPPLPSDFELGVERNLGMTPSEIRKLRQLLDERQKAAAEIPNPPKSVTGSISVSLDPGSTPPVVRPFYGVSTSIVVLDSTGSPWPVENFALGNRDLFSVERLDGPEGSTFVIVPHQTYGQSNLILKLKGLPTPVVINLVSGQKVHDARVEARVLGLGPNAQVTTKQLTAGVDSRLLSVLDGVPPQGRAIEVIGDEKSQAWVMPDGFIWLRTDVDITIPAPISFTSASDGTTVYKLAPISSVVGKLNGQYINLSFEGCLQECSYSGQGW